MSIIRYVTLVSHLPLHHAFFDTQKILCYRPLSSRILIPTLEYVILPRHISYTFLSLSYVTHASAVVLPSTGISRHGEQGN